MKGNQGIQYNIDTWHYPLITLHKKQDFIVIDRENSNENINVVKLKEKYNENCVHRFDEIKVLLSKEKSSTTTFFPLTSGGF